MSVIRDFKIRFKLDDMQHILMFLAALNLDGRVKWNSQQEPLGWMGWRKNPLGDWRKGNVWFFVQEYRMVYGETDDYPLLEQVSFEEVKDECDFEDDVLLKTLILAGVTNE